MSGFAGHRRGLVTFPLARTLAWLALLGLVAGTSGPAAAAAPAKIYVAFHWHMHQPIYWPYEQITETLHNPNCTDAVKDYLTWPDRVGAYTHYPIDTLRANGNLPHMGAQVSFSGSLIENLDDLARANLGYGRDWASQYREARSWKTALGNPRLDLTGFGFHHPLMGLIDYADCRKQIQAHRDILLRTFGGSYSKGIFPPENAFSERMIPALVDEGFEWVLVDNLHFDRANQGYPWTKQQVMIPPNQADARNPAQPQYVALTCQQNTVNVVSAGFGFRPHYAQYVDPATGRAETPAGRPARMVVVPTERSIGYDDSYGDRDPISRLAQLEPYNQDPRHPFLIVMAHDGDNAGASGSRYYLDTCRWVQAQPDRFVITTVQDYLQQFPPDPADVIHVEDGAWAGADIGDQEFKKWNGDPYLAGQVDHERGYSPDRNSWAAVTAAKNRVLTAEDVAPGAPLAAEAWRQFMVGETSCYWYWDGTFEWDMKPTIACNNAVAVADELLGPGCADRVPPTLFIPQREPYNPGALEWDKLAPGAGAPFAASYGGRSTSPDRAMPSDFTVWTLAYDVSGLARVTLRYRVSDASAVGAANLVYAGGEWRELPMEAKAIPDVGPALGKAKYKAEQYSARVVGLARAMVDYYVEAADAAGNVQRTALQHVWVGDRCTVADTVEPPAPTTHDVVTVRSGSPGALHWGVNGWKLPPKEYWPEGTTAWTDGRAVETPFKLPAADDTWQARLGPFSGAAPVRVLNFVFHNADGTWGKDQAVAITDSAGGPAGGHAGGPADGADLDLVLIEGLSSPRTARGFSDELLRVQRSATRARFAPRDQAERRAAQKEWRTVSDEVAARVADALAAGDEAPRRLLVKFRDRNPHLSEQLDQLLRKVGHRTPRR